MESNNLSSLHASISNKAVFEASRNNYVKSFYGVLLVLMPVNQYSVLAVLRCLLCNQNTSLLTHKSRNREVSLGGERVI